MELLGCDIKKFQETETSKKFQEAELSYISEGNLQSLKIVKFLYFL